MIILCPQCRKETELEHVERGRHIECVCHARFTLDDATVVADYSKVDEAPPEKIGPYRIERFIGRGGMGKVYKGIHPTLGLPVAVKTMLQEYAANETFKRRFIQSAKICAKLNHPNIVRVYDFGTTSDGMLYLVMEYIAGGTLADLMMRSGPLDPRKTAAIADSVCEGLIVASKLGIVHRDIKPDNIMITSEGECKLADLGLAKYEPAEESAVQNSQDTMELSSLGTPEYMAPEQAVNARNCDVRADIYSLGITLYELLTGQLPFQADNAAELRRKHLEEEPKVPGFYRPGIPIDLEYIVMRCIQKRKLDRYQTPADLHADLRAFLDGLPLPSTTSGAIPCPLPVLREKPAEPAKRRLSPVRIGWTLLLLLTAGLLFLLIQTFREGVEPERHGENAFDPAMQAEEFRSPPFHPEESSGREALWKKTKLKAMEALRDRIHFDNAVLNLKTFENESDIHCAEARSLIEKLSDMKKQEVALLLRTLDKHAEPFIREKKWPEALQVYSSNIDGLEQESRSDREQRMESIRQRIREEEERKKKGREYIEKKVLPLLAAGDYKAAKAICVSPENPAEPEPEFISLIAQCESIPVLFAERVRSEIGETCRYRFQKEPLASWQEEGMKIISVVPPDIYVQAEDRRSFTIRDLRTEDQAGELEKLQTITADARSLWNAGALVFDYPEEAMNYAERLPAILKEPYMAYIADWHMKRKAENFRRDLRSLLGSIGYTSSDLPEPDQLLNLSIFEFIESDSVEMFSRRLDMLIRQYEEVPSVEPYISVLKQLPSAIRRNLRSPAVPRAEDSAGTRSL